MLSIKRLGNASEAGGYYSEAGYYTKDGVALASEWGGEGANALGFDGQPVDLERFTEILEGKIDEVTQLGKSDGQGNISHAPGHDFTFSAPKGISIAALMGGDERLIDAHHAAVKVAMAELEKRVIARKDGEHIHTNNLMYASFTHTTSRANDPQLHTHNVIPNATLIDGKWYSLESKEMYQFKMQAGLIYRSELAVLAHKLGYTVEVTDRQKGFWDIAEISDELKAETSKRRREVEQSAAEREVTTQKGLETVAVMSRASKSVLTPEQLWEIWDDTATSLGVDVEQIVKDATTKADERVNAGMAGGMEQTELDQQNPPKNTDKPIPGVDDEALRATRLAARALAANEAVFSSEQIQVNAMKLGMGMFSFADVEAALSGLIAEKELLVRPHGITTPEAIRKESYIVSSMLNLKGRYAPVATKEIAREHITAFEQELSARLGFAATLTSGQAKAVELIATTKDAVIGVQGQAGTGKTTMVNVVNSIAHAQGYTMVGLAQSGSATETLFEETGIKSHTLDSFIFRTQQNQETYGPRFAEKEIWLIDEASLANAGHFADVITAARQSGARIVFTGDTAQHEAIEWGKLFHLLQAHGMKTAVMDDITRQRNSPELLAAIKAYYAGQFDKTFALLKDCIHESKKPLAQITEAFNKLTPNKREDALFIIPSNAQRREFNIAARSTLQQEGHISNENIPTKIFLRANLNFEEMKDVRFFQNYNVDAVEFHKSMPEQGVIAGERYLVDLKQSNIKTNELHLTNMKTGEVRQFSLFSLQDDKAKMTLDAYRLDTIDLSKDEIVTWKKTRKDMGLMNGDKLKLIGVDEKSSTFTFTNIKNGEAITLDQNQHHDLDYSYSVTSQVSQGMTQKESYSLLSSTNKNLSTFRALLVNISRATDKAHLFVDNTKKLIEVMHDNNFGKTIATRHVSTESMQKYAAHTKGNEADIGRVVEDDLNKAMANLAEKKGVFTHDDIKREALKWSLGRYTPLDIDQGIEKARALKTLTLVAPGDNGNHTFAMATTIKHEAALAKHVIDGVGRRAKMLSASHFDRYSNAYNAAAAEKGLTAILPHQRDVMERAFTSRNESAFVATYARDGVTHAFRTAGAAMLQDAGYRVRAFGFNAKTCDDIAKAQLPGGNIKAWLSQLEARAANGQKTNNSKDVWLIDDAALLDAKTILDISRFARYTGARVIFLGNELENSLSWGNTLELLRSQKVEVIGSSSKALSQDEKVSAAAQSFRDGRIAEALHGVEQLMHEVHHQTADKDKTIRHDVLAQSYLAIPAGERNQVAVIIPDRTTNDAVTGLIRQGLKDEGVISDDRVSVVSEHAVFLSNVERTDARMYKEGFVVRLSNNVPLVVTEVHKENNTLVLSDQNGQTYKISGNDLHQATISQQIKTNFADGDRIIFTKALPKENTTNQNGKGKSNLRGVKNKSEGTVLGYNKETKTLTIELANGRVVGVNPHDFPHIKHNYASSAFSLKSGEAKQHALVLLESNKTHSLTHEQIHGVLSNVRGSVRIITDDKAKALSALKENPGFRQSALAEKGVQVTSKDRAADFSKELGAMMGGAAKIGMKFRERVMDKIEQIKKNYNIGLQRERSL
ncbi:conjugative relaxase [Aeromonas hydrophila]|uniref:MobF family relaxase n=1 Tax=Aeromonas hydrophila TaxID=644 RepID=UPI001C5BB541|nr:MobF family relaxase [Aeromonas hydrophila]MBW3799002.1 conjugative relaxase [Aeromonas hydrophila]MBW3803794.1 conjugative relaxase [Aeromonas hydrophila]MBW3821931.1 conjugative relaxase [Aeromonas hydrophila]